MKRIPNRTQSCYRSSSTRNFARMPLAIRRPATSATRPACAESRQADQCRRHVSGKLDAMRRRGGNQGHSDAADQPAHLASRAGLPPPNWLCNLDRSGNIPAHHPAMPGRAAEELHRQGDLGEGRRSRLCQDGGNQRGRCHQMERGDQALGSVDAISMWDVQRFGRTGGLVALGLIVTTDKATISSFDQRQRRRPVLRRRAPLVDSPVRNRLARSATRAIATGRRHQRHRFAVRADVRSASKVAVAVRRGSRCRRRYANNRSGNCRRCIRHSQLPWS